MIIEGIILLSLFIVFIIYILFLKDFFSVRKIYKHLRKFLDARDTLVLKLIPEIDNKENAARVVCLIDERRENFKTSYNNSIFSDIKLNSELRKFYEHVNTISKNELANNVFSKIIKLEKDLKNIRNKYSLAVEEYNKNLIKHKFICLKVIKMKPLDTYNIKNKNTSN